ncbi:MAG: hypothetical protein JXA78_06175 [Anaerolineales bacterium]|nr:hypothetical protein [Anaerolineales bacterium]
MNARFFRLILGFILLGALALFACQLPERVIQSLSQAQPTGSSLPGMRTPYPGSVYPGLDVSPAYPGSAAYPTQLAVTERSPAYPGQDTQLPTPSATLSITAQLTQGTASPGAGAGTTYPQQDGTAYPDQESAYPLEGASETQMALTLTAIAYPGLEADTPSAPAASATGTLTPTPSVTLVSGGSPSPTPTATTGGASPQPGTASPTATTAPGSTPTVTLQGAGTGSPTPTGTTVLASTPTPSNTPIAATATPTFTRTPFLTSTPTLTRTPTLTPTPLPPPPWVSAELHATDPQAVQLASGRVQLIEFFAYWSGTCQAMAPIVHGLEGDYATRMNFIYLDIDDPANLHFKRELGFRMEPHFFLLDAQGRVLRQWIGYVSRQQFIQAFNDALGQ